MVKTYEAHYEINWWSILMHLWLCTYSTGMFQGVMPNIIPISTPKWWKGNNDRWTSFNITDICNWTAWLPFKLLKLHSQNSLHHRNFSTKLPLMLMPNYLNLLQDFFFLLIAIGSYLIKEKQIASIPLLFIFNNIKTLRNFLYCLKYE